MFAGKHLCWSLLFNKVAGLQASNFIKNRLQYRCFPVNIAKFLKPILKNIYEHLLLSKLPFGVGVTWESLKNYKILLIWTFYLPSSGVINFSSCFKRPMIFQCLWNLCWQIDLYHICRYLASILTYLKKCEWLHPQILVKCSFRN